MEDKLKATLLLNNLCVELPLLDIGEINETYNKVNNKVKETDDHYDVLIYASITTSMWEVGIGFKEFQN